MPAVGFCFEPADFPSHGVGEARGDFGRGPECAVLALLALLFVFCATRTDKDTLVS